MDLVQLSELISKSPYSLLTFLLIVVWWAADAIKRKDNDIKENVDRGEKEESISKKSQEQIPSVQTEVKNANASGQGSMGRNDQEEEITKPEANS